MFKAKQRITSMFVAFCTFLVTAILAISMIAVPTNSVTASAAETEIVFNLGANGTASHYDNNTKKTTYSQTVDGYTLSITGGTNMYPDSRDAKGNSCIKLGTGSNAGSFTLTAPDDVIKVIIEIAQYKANAATVKVNDTSTTLTKSSNNGEYNVITVDTTSQKTISLAVSSGKRAMRVY